MGAPGVKVEKLQTATQATGSRQQESSSFSGTWIARNDDKITLPIKSFKVTSATKCEISGIKGELHLDGTIHWSNRDIWKRDQACGAALGNVGIDAHPAQAVSPRLGVPREPLVCSSSAAVGDTQASSSSSRPRDAEGTRTSSIGSKTHASKDNQELKKEIASSVHSFLHGGADVDWLEVEEETHDEGGSSGTRHNEQEVEEETHDEGGSSGTRHNEQ